MATVQHSTITDPNIHEPKGVSTAGASEIYIADGAGSGEWRKISAPEIEGIGSDGGVSGLGVVSDGLGGLQFQNIHAHGSMTITNNATNFPVTAVADTTFNTPSQYVLFSGTGAPWAAENLHDVTFDGGNRLTVTVTGIYMIHLWMGLISYPSSTASISVRYLINGTTYSSRKPIVKSGGVGAKDQLSGFGLVALNAGDYVQITVASDTTGNLVIGDCNSTLLLVRAT